MNGSGVAELVVHVRSRRPNARAATADPAARYTARSSRSHLRTMGCSIHIAPSTPPAMSVNAAEREDRAPGTLSVARSCAGCRPGSRPVSLGVQIGVSPTPGYRLGRMGEAGRITDEGVERLRARIGIPEPHPMPPYYTLPTHDTFRNVAVAYGDDNPLWCDPAYGPKTRWDQSIASPVLVGGDTLIGEDEVTRRRARACRPDEGRPVAGRARVLRRPAHASGGPRCTRCGARSAATRSWPRSTSRASSRAVPSTNGPRRCSATTPARCSRVSTG